MAGTVTVTQSSNYFGTARDRFRTLAFVSDVAAGSIPDQDLYGLDGTAGIEWLYDPDAVATPANTFDIVIVEKANPTRIVWQSGESGGGGVDATAYKREIMNYSGVYPPVDGPLTVKFVSPADHSNACNVGNSKEGTIVFRFQNR